MLPVEAMALAFDRACRVAGVAYALIGGMAVNAWGQQRNTEDIDVLVALGLPDIDRFVRCLRAEGLAASDFDLREAFRDPGQVTVSGEAIGILIDLKLARTPSEAAQVRSAVDVAYEAGRLRVARPEDMVVFKLKFGSPRDVQDARSILVRQAGRLDLRRMWALAERIGVRAALHGLLRELGAEAEPDSEDEA